MNGNTGEVNHRIGSRDDRHYYGHGAFDPQGRLLYVPENDFALGRGVIGVYDAADGFRRLGEFPSYGVGPHEIGLFNDGSTLVVANGGIRTHPDLGRRKLNLEEMAPNLAYVETQSGRRLDAYTPPAALHRLSIRHLDITRDDTVCLAMQWQGPAEVHPPLVARHRGEQRLPLLSACEPIQSAMRHYGGGVRCDRSGQWFAVSAPRGNLITFWSAATGDYVGQSTIADGCGIGAGPLPGQFIVSGGRGDLHACHIVGERVKSIEIDASPQLLWDNHMTTSSWPVEPSTTS